MRIFLSLVLAAGAVFGIGGGIARLHHGGRHHREHMMDRVAETCVRAARTVDQEGPDGRPAPQTVFIPYPVAMPMPMMPAPGMPMPPSAVQAPVAAQTAPAPGR